MNGKVPLFWRELHSAGTRSGKKKFVTRWAREAMFSRKKGGCWHKRTQAATTGDMSGQEKMKIWHSPEAHMIKDMNSKVVHPEKVYLDFLLLYKVQQF